MITPTNFQGFVSCVPDWDPVDIQLNMI